jgi:hypothetical protein
MNGWIVADLICNSEKYGLLTGNVIEIARCGEEAA